MVFIFLQGQFCTFFLFLHLLSHYLNAAENTAGRAVSTPTVLSTAMLCQGAGIAACTELRHTAVFGNRWFQLPNPLSKHRVIWVQRGVVAAGIDVGGLLPYLLLVLSNL